MATADEILQLRALIGDTTEPYEFTDEYLGLVIDANADLDEAAVVVWEAKAASLSTMVNISESGSSRSNSQLYTNALAQLKYFRDKINQGEAESATRSRTRAIRRV